MKDGIKAFLIISIHETMVECFQCNRKDVLPTQPGISGETGHEKIIEFPLKQ